MIRIREILLPEHVLLDMDSTSGEEAIRQIAKSLRSDTRIADRQNLLRALHKCEASGKVNLERGLTLPHVRTPAVTKMIMAFGRLAQPLREKEGPLQFVVLIGIPLAMDAEYLRLVGTLMWVFRNEKLRQKLLDAKNPSEIIRIFEKGESGIDRDE